jgi:DNA-binding MarR family transcriptional regulator
MTVSKTAAVDPTKASRPVRKEADAAAEATTLQLGELSELLGYSLKRAQLKVFEDFLRCVAPLQLTPAQFSVMLLLDKNPGRNQTEIANTLGILRPNFVAMLDGLESRDLCARIRSTNDRRSHILVLTDKGRAVLARAKKLVAAKHEARLTPVIPGALHRHCEEHLRRSNPCVPSPATVDCFAEPVSGRAFARPLARMTVDSTENIRHP